MNDENGDSDKYLDPAQNPMILTPTADVPSGGEIEDKYLDPAQNSFIPGSDGARYDLSAEALAGKIADAFPGKDEIEIGGRVLIRMATGAFTEKGTGKTIAELTPADCRAISDFLTNREKS